MKSNIKFLALASLSFLAFNACDNDDDDNIRVPDNLSQALIAKYPTAQRIEWEKKGEYYVAECYVNQEEKDVWFTANGEWKMTETEIYWNSLPASVQNSFQSSRYATWKRDDYDMLEYPAQETLYVIEVEQGKTEYQLFYTEDGTLKEEKDVSRQSDEHWPKHNGNGNSIIVPDNLSQALTAKYPTAQRIEWEMKGMYYVAECYVNQEEKDIWFTAAGEWKMTETEILWSSLPANVQNSFESSKYATWIREDYDMLEYPAQETLYVIEVEQGNEEYQLFYTEDGTLKEEKNVSRQSDEHWPK